MDDTGEQADATPQEPRGRLRRWWARSTRIRRNVAASKATARRDPNGADITHLQNHPPF